jgi:hypothetical protein
MSARFADQAGLMPGAARADFAIRSIGAATSFARLVYGWFTEGFDTRDLKEAKAVAGGVGGITFC